MGFLFTNAICITLDENSRIITDGAVYVEGEKIKEIGTSADLKKKYEGVEIVDVKGRILMPGFINLHSHFYSAFARGMALNGPTATNFVEILNYVWWRLDKVLDLEDVYYSGLLCCLDNIRNGTTTVFDHHASPFHAKGSLYELERAFRITGLRGCLCYEVSDRDGAAITDHGIAENSEFIKKCAHGDDMLKGIFGIHASFTVSDNTLDRIAAEVKALNTGIHIHCAEDKADQDHCLKEHKMRVVQRLEKHTLLNEKAFLVHCIHINEDEMKIAKNHGCTIIHNPESNMNNAVGCSDVIKMNEMGITVGLGTDGYSARMANGIRLLPILHRHVKGNPSIGYDIAWKLPFENNAKVASSFYKAPVGAIKEGAYADLVVMDYIPPTPMAAGSFMGHFIFGMSETPVLHTMSAGRFLMRDRVITLVDEEEVLKKTNEMAAKVWKKL